MAITVTRTLPKGWRIGQFWFNFFEWLRTDKGYEAQVDWSGDTPRPVGRMADPFNIPDSDWERLTDEYFDYLHKMHNPIDGT